MTLIKTLRKTFPRVTKWEDKGKFIYFIDCRSRRWGMNSQYKRHTESEVMKFADEISSKLFLNGSMAFAVKSESENLRLKNLEDGLPAGFTLEIIKNQFMAMHAKATMTIYPQIEPLAQEWLEFKGRPSLKPITASALRDCKSYCLWIIAQWGKLKCNEVTRDMVEAAILAKEGISGVTQKKYLLFVSSFFKWVIERKQIDIKNPAKGIDVAVQETEIKIFSIEDIRRMLEFTEEHFPHMAGYYALCTWVGARPSEVCRMTWADVKFETSEIAVDRVGKTGARFADISKEPQVMEYLAKLKATGMPLVPKYCKNQATLWRKALRTLEIQWIQDGLRHNTVSYYYNKTKDWNEVEHRFGHDRKTSEKYYRRVISKETLEEFWNMLGENKTLTK